MSIPALQSGVAGINTGLANLKRDAAQVAQAGTRGADGQRDLTQPLVNLTADRLQVEASAKVVETVHDLIGRFLDITA
jgi:hypothetical protein